MSSAQCPQCQTLTINALGKSFCPQCGWNREAAEKRTQLFMRLLPLSIIVFDAPLVIWIFRGNTAAAVLGVLGVLAFVPIILLVIALRAKVRVEIHRPRAKQVPSAISPQEETGSVSAARISPPQVSAPNDEAAKQYALLAQAQRPRQVRMSRQGKLGVFLISLALLVFAGALIALAKLQPAGSGQNVAPRPWPVVFVPVVALLALIVFATYRSLNRQKQLLANGELAMAHITKQWIARNGHGIHYEFTTPSGETFSRMTTDSARELMEGMDTPVFYDRHDAKKQVALCASIYEIVLPGKL